MKFRYIDLFSGIGGFRIGLDAVGGKSVGYSEIDKRAIETYQQNFDDPASHNLGDVTSINSLPEVDLIVGGVPCQSWSVAGKKRGFDDPRGKLWYDAIRMVDIARPRVFAFENVKGLIDPRNRANLELIIEHFEELGYTVKYQLLNSFDFGVPQNRSRIFIVGFREDMAQYASKFTFPKPNKVHQTIGSLLDGVIDRSINKKKFSPSDIFGKVIPRSRNAFQKLDELNDFFIFCDTRGGHSTIHSWDIYDTTSREKEICEQIMKNRRKKKYGKQDGNPMSLEQIIELVPETQQKDLESLIAKKILKTTPEGKYTLVNSKNSSGIDGVYRVFLPNSSIFSTLTATGTRDFIATDYIECDDPAIYKQLFIDQIFRPGKYRPVTSREAARIQGFPDTFIYHSKAYSAQKQFGNAVSPPVISALAHQIVKTGVFDTIELNERAAKEGDFGQSQRVDALQLDFFTS